MLFAMVPVTFVSLVTKPTKVVPRVEELVPPLAMGRIPVTSEAKLTWPIFNSPPTERTMPVPREERVVEPLVATLKKEEPLVEATTNIGRV